ncbi:hypothetical protein ZIOFF_055631 [Zingiber officinale]|uniref:BED-type domain-containing protein n=1 Tax=Zingiber officinale TaxID=94328 RepID=A0A8J5FCA1_ZINOF|nr:hypothetical protein ZIOFF_055631 [Zingiber officinale]
MLGICVEPCTKLLNRALSTDMADASSSGSLSIISIPARSSDPAWQYGITVEGHRNTIICVLCNKTIRAGGITRLKYHLAGIEGNVEAWKKVSDDVKWQMKQLINSLNKKQEQRKRLRNEIRGLRKDKDTLLEIFDQVVHEVGVENVVQFIIDNDASYKVAGKATQQRYGTFFCPPFTKQKEVARGLLTTVTRLVPDDDVQDKISAQLEEYKASTSVFGLSIAIRQLSPLLPHPPPTTTTNRTLRRHPSKATKLILQDLSPKAPPLAKLLLEAKLLHQRNFSKPKSYSMRRSSKLLLAAKLLRQ